MADAASDGKCRIALKSIAPSYRAPLALGSERCSRKWGLADEPATKSDFPVENCLPIVGTNRNGQHNTRSKSQSWQQLKGDRLL